MLLVSVSVIAIGILGAALGVLSHHIVLKGLRWNTATRVPLVVRCTRRLALRRLRMVVLVQLLNIQTSISLVHIDVAVNGALNLNSLRTVALLGVKLTAVHRLDVHDIALRVLTTRVIGRRDDGLTGRIETEVRLVHQLLVETRVDLRVVVLNSLVALVLPFGSTILEQLVQDRLLLVIVKVHSFALDGTAT